MSSNEDRLREFLKLAFGIETPEQIEAYFEYMEEQRELHPPVKEGTCYFCGVETTDEDFCYGCKNHICPECMGPFELVPMGPHVIEAHVMSKN